MAVGGLSKFYNGLFSRTTKHQINICFISQYLYLLIFGVYSLISINLADLHSNKQSPDTVEDNLDIQSHSPYSPLEFSSSEDQYEVYTDKNMNMDIPIIIWWTNNLYPHFDRKLPVVQCEDIKCYSTVDRQYLSDKRTRGLLFYGTDLHPSDLPLPRENYHEWALFHEESPINNFMLNHNIFMKLINHTATFRRESDYPLTTQNIYNPNYLIDRQPIPLEIKNKIREKENQAPVLYVQTHCEVPSDRDRYVSELMKYIDVDSYGACLHNKDLPQHLQDPVSNYEIDEFLQLIASYKFHLAFENAICKDYMTEKLMRPLHVGSVPVYKGSPNAEDWMPNNKSIIMVDDFESPKQLAEFLNYLDNNNEEYMKYLEFKKPNGVTNKLLKDHLSSRKWQVNLEGNMEFFRGFECHLCHELTKRTRKEKDNLENSKAELLPPKMANSSHLGCPQPYTSLGHPGDIKNNSDIWQKMQWVNMYWEGFDHARAVRDMLLNKETDSSTFYKYLEKLTSNKK